jgi:hypothetical protein
MPPAVAALTTLGGGSALGGAITAGTAAMGVYGAVKDRGAAKDAARSQERQRDESQAFIEKMGKQGRQDLFRLFSEGQQSREKGLQSGLDLYKQTIPLQLNQFQMGNINAQRQIAGGLPGIESAFLGTGQPMQTNVWQPDLSKLDFRAPQAPQFAPITQASPTANVARQQPLSDDQIMQDPRVMAMMEQFGGNY